MLARRDNPQLSLQQLHQGQLRLAQLQAQVAELRAQIAERALEHERVRLRQQTQQTQLNDQRLLGLQTQIRDLQRPHVLVRWSMTRSSATWTAIIDVKNTATTFIRQSYLAVMDDDETMSDRKFWFCVCVMLGGAATLLWTTHSLTTYTYSAIRSIWLFATSPRPHSPQTLPPFHTPSSLEAACEQYVDDYMNRETFAMLENSQQRTCQECAHDPAVPSTLNAILRCVSPLFK